MSKTSVPLKDLVVGDIIYANIIIDKADMADPNSKSGTAKNIKAGKPVRRLCVVLVAGSSSVVVTYLATFNQSKTLPASFTDKSYWYPVSPATKEGTLDPLPSLNGTAQWVSLRKKQTVAEDPVEKVTEKFSAASVKLILAAMKA